MRMEQQAPLQPLSDHPNEWTEVDHRVLGRYRQLWAPGAFGDRPDIRGVRRYRVTRENWVDIGPEGIPERQILEAEVMEEDAQEG